MKKIILIGKTEAGKTSLAQKLLKETIAYQKTQTVNNFVNFIDTPGEYLENRFYYNALIASSNEAEIIGFVEECSAKQGYFAPGFALAFGKPTIGIITKIDKAESPEDIETAKKRLLLAGVSLVVAVSAFDGSGIDELRNLLED